MKFLENETICLRALEPEDAGYLYKWENDTALWQMGATLSPYSRFAIEEYLKDARLDIFATRQLRLMVTVKTDSGNVAGMIDLYDFDPHHRRAGVGILIDPDYQNKGLATQALKEMERYAFDFLHFHQLYAYVPNVNTASYKLFRKLGYQSAGVLKEWLYVGKKWLDVTIMQKFIDA
ncbi:MAG: GNAT family N-acetyltransferase [Bacteroidales bacterium]|nr:GNAT family N-acetyltransferase [Bacteroidales bacterium]